MKSYTLSKWANDLYSHNAFRTHTGERANDYFQCSNMVYQKFLSSLMKRICAVAHYFNIKS